MTTPNLGGRSSNARYTLLSRVEALELATKRIPSRYLNGRVGYVSQIILAGSHGFAVGDWIGLTGSTWAKAQATSTNAYKAIGVVKLVIDADYVEVVLQGLVQIRSYTLADWTGYYLSATAGTVASTAPTKPKWRIPLVQSFIDNWIYLNGYPWTGSNQERLSDLLDVDSTTVEAPNDQDILTYDTATTSWKAASVLVALGSRAALSVIGRAANSIGAPADIAASTTGDVLHMGASSLVWGQLGTASYQDASVTTAKLGVDVVLNSLQDVSVTGAANKEFLRFNGTAWVNYDLGPIAYASTTSILALDGGATGSPTKVLLSDSSRLILSGSGSPGSAIEWKLSGDVDLGTEVVARARAPNSNQVSLYDQGGATITTGTEVVRWGCSATAGSRYFRFMIPVQVQDTGSSNLIIGSGSSQTWTVTNDITPFTWMTFYGSGADAFGTRIKIQGTIDGGGTTGLTIFGDRSNGTSSSRLNVGATDGAWFQSGNLALSASTQLTMLGTGGGVQIATATSEKVGFWGRVPVTKTTVADPSAITTTQTAGATYGANEQAMLAALKADVIALRATLLNVTDAGQAVGLF